MATRRTELRVYPDGGRLEEALVRAAEVEPFVDASGFCTLGQLLERLEAGTPRRPVGSGWTLRLLVRSEVERLGSGPFGDWARGPAFSRAARELLAELKAGGMNPLSFRRACRALPPAAREKAAWLSRLWWQYERALAVRGLEDPEARLLASVRRLREEGMPPSWSGVRRVSLHAVHDFPPLRLQWLLALAQACERAGVGLHVKVPAGGGPGVDAVVDPLLQALERAAQDFGRVEAFKEDVALESGLGPLMAVLFTPVPRAVAVPRDRVRLLRAPSEREERRAVVLGVVRALEEGVPPEQIAVVRPGMPEVAGLLREELAAAGVPASYRRGGPLGRTALGRAVLGLPLLVERGFQAAAVEAV
ncbi:MAG: hypothetical protein FJ086_18855, partial [Deltaproteobacteria bacterium]|nr:hypothetical protein [Deltaproteobacteria bacterium]